MSVPPTHVTLKDLVFVEGDAQVTIPAGSPCTIFNHVLHKQYVDEGELLKGRAREKNWKAGQHAFLVMIVAGRPRLLAQTDIGLKVATPTAQVPAAPPLEVSPAPKVSKQSTLF